MSRVPAIIAGSRAIHTASTNRLAKGLSVFAGLILVFTGTSYLWIGYESGQLIFWGFGVDWFALVLLAIVILVAGLLFAFRVIAEFLVLPAGEQKLALVLVASAVILVTGFFTGWYDGGFELHAFRDNFGFAVASIGTAMIAIAFSRPSLPAIASRRPDLVVGLTALFVLGASIVMSGFVMQGIAHCHDSFTYLMQGRFFWAYGLETPAEPYPELFVGKTGLRMGQGEHGFAGKYPMGWPVILGAVDYVTGAPWLANALIAAALVLATFLMMRQVASREFAALTACVLGLSPWLAISAGDQLSHLPTILWLVLFMAGYYALTHRPSILTGIGAGLALGFAVATRAHDSLFFALPVMAMSVIQLRREFSKLAAPFALLSLCTLAGAGAYLGYNYLVTGDPLVSSYYVVQTVETTAFLPVPDEIPEFDIGHALFGLHERLADVQREWLVGTAPVVIFVLYGFLRGRIYWYPARLFLVSSLMIALAYGGFIILGETWLDPRGYVPLAPGLAILIAAGLRAAIDDVKGLGDAILRGAAASLAVGWLVGLPVFSAHQIMSPPHGVDRQLVNAVQEAGLTEAVIGLPTRYSISQQVTKPHYKIPLAGLWSMQVPFENNPVVFVGTVDDWQRKARDRFPGRRLYQVNREAGNFTFYDVAEAQ